MTWPTARRALSAAAIVSVLVAAIAHAVPESFAPHYRGLALPFDASSLVAAVFLAATWWLTLRRGDTKPSPDAWGLALGGLTEPEPLSARRILLDGARALAWALALALLVFPAFWLGYRMWFGIQRGFASALPSDLRDRVLGQLLVVALPEEAFFRGFLQSSLDARWGTRWRVLGAAIGPGLFVSAGIFAVGHMLTIPQPARLAVFFPALLFGWLRARTKGIGAAVIFHALCNVFSGLLAHGYGLR